jgi:hypothetical protein
LLIGFCLLIAPAPYHRIVANSRATSGLFRFASRTVEAALLPFALGLGVTLLVGSRLAVNGRWPAAAATAAIAIAVGFWYGLGFYARRKYGGKDSMQTDTEEDPKLEEKIKEVLIELRMVLPGTQALLGFQFITVLLRDFSRLPASLRYLHLVSLALVAFSTVLLITPAAYHRIVERGESTERFHRFASAMVLASLVPLAAGTSGDFLVVVEKVTGSAGFAVVSGLVALFFFYTVWFGLMLWLRRQRFAQAV